MNIHTEPIKTQAQQLIKHTLSISTSLSITISDKDGNIKSHREINKKPAQPSKIEHSFIYKFDDWPGNEDIVALCNSFINEIEIFIDEGKKLNFIT